MTTWTEDEKTYLRNNWNEMSIQDIADDLDRTYKSVRNKGRDIMPENKKKQSTSNSGKEWTEEEEEKLKEMIDDHKIMDVVDELENRSYPSVRYKMRDLELPPKEQVREDQERWSDEEESTLRDNWKDMSKERLQEKLDRTRGSIDAKARNLGLPRKRKFKHWTDEEEEFLRNNYTDTPVREIAKELEDRDEGSVESKARKMGLVKYSDSPQSQKEHEFTTVNHKIDIDEDELKIVPIGDIHLGHPACDEDMLFSLLEDLEEGDDPYRILLMGDLWEGATKNSPNFQFAMKYPPQKQYQNLLAVFEDYSDKVLGSVVGNHEDFARNVTGYQKMRDFCRELEIPFLKYTGAVNISLNGIYYRILMTHGSSGARTWGGKINALARMNDVVPDASLYLYAHTHARAVVTDANYRSTSRNSKKRRRTYILTGGFLGYPGTYADKKNYPPSSLGVVPIRLSSEEKKLRTEL